MSFYLKDDPAGWNFNLASDMLNFAYDRWTPAVRTRCVSSEISFYDCPLGFFTLLHFDALIWPLYRLLCSQGFNKPRDRCSVAELALPRLSWNRRLIRHELFEHVNLWICRLAPETKIYQYSDHSPSIRALNETGSCSRVVADGTIVHEYICVGDWTSVEHSMLRAAWKTWDDANPVVVEQYPKRTIMFRT